MHVLRSDRLEVHPRLRGLGPEPFDPTLTGASLYAVTRKRRVPVKNFLMNTRAIAGIGNIYACETLFRAGLNPKRQVRRIGRAGWERLTTELREGRLCGISTMPMGKRAISLLRCASTIARASRARAVVRPSGRSSRGDAALSTAPVASADPESR
jgi:hypothetical protein